MADSRVAVCAPSDFVLHLYPIFSDGDQRFARVDGEFVRLEDLPNFVREESAQPKNPIREPLAIF
jgi:hypothetical protein